MLCWALLCITGSPISLKQCWGGANRLPSVWLCYGDRDSVLFVSSLATRNRCPQGSDEKSQLLSENCTWYLLYFLYLWRASLCGIWWFLWQNSSFQNMPTIRAGINGSHPWSEFAQSTLYIWGFYIHRCCPLYIRNGPQQWVCMTQTQFTDVLFSASASFTISIYTSTHIVFNI